MARNDRANAALKLCEPLICVGLKAVLRIPDGVVDAGMKWVKGRFTDHSLVLTNAVTISHDRAWQAVALALAPDTLFSHVANLFRDGDLKAVQKQIREFVATADTGLDGAAAGLRTKACNELLALKKAGRFGLDGADLTSLDLTRFASTAKVADDAHRAIQVIATDLMADAPHLAQVLTLTPPAGGTPLIAAAFAYFLRGEIVTKPELARDLHHDQLRLLTFKQQAGFNNLEEMIETNSGELLEVLGGWFTTTDADLADIKAKLEQLLEHNQVSKKAESPLRVSVTSEAELQRLKKLRDRLREQPVELVDAELQSLLGDGLAAAGQYADAEKAHGAAATAAHAVADTTTEADAAYKQFKDACKLGRWDAALTALRRAIALDERRFRPVPEHYVIDGILGVGSFGVVLKCRDSSECDEEGEDVVVAVKTFRHDDLDRSPDEVFAEATVLKRLGHENTVGIHEWGFADRETRKRPFIAMEFVPGVTLEKYLAVRGRLDVGDFSVVFRQIAAGLHAAHVGRRPVIHRDFKPANVMVHKSSSLFAADFNDWRRSAKQLFDRPVQPSSWPVDSSMGWTIGIIWGSLFSPELAKQFMDLSTCVPHPVSSAVLAELNSLRPQHMSGDADHAQSQYDERTQEKAIKAGVRLAYSKLQLPDDGPWDVRVIDFGLAVRSTTRATSLSVSPPFRTSRDLSVAGTVKYAAPEQLGERSYPVGPHSDVFAFGKTALEALIGTTQPTPKHWKKLPEWLAEMLGRCVDEDFFPNNPDEGRFHNFEPILEVLNNPPLAASPTPSETSPEPRFFATNQAPDTVSLEEAQELLGRLADEFAAEERASQTHTAKHQFTCPECLFQWDLSPPPRGYSHEVVICPSCGCNTEVNLNAKDRGATSPEPVQPLKPAASPKHRTACPLCRARFKFPPKRGGESVKCPQCGMWLILPTQDGGTAIISPTPAPEPASQTRKAGDKLYLPLPGGLWMAFAWCPPGTFLMGSPASEMERESNEQQHEVRLTKGFYAGVHPVTRGEFAQFMAISKYKTEAETSRGGYKWDGGAWIREKACNWRNPGFSQDDSHPVTVVNWNDAKAFADWLREHSGRVVRLPTEAEWEYACRGGTSTPFYWGGELNGMQANCSGKRPYGTDTKGAYLGGTTPVGSYTENTPLKHEWGLTDVHGNVWEWCSDWYSAGFYARSPKDDPECQDGEQKNGEEKRRVLRGGSWRYMAWHCRAASRWMNVPGESYSHFGFRVVFCPN